MTYSIDFRQKVLWIKEREPLSFDEAAERFGVGRTSVVRWSKQRETKNVRNKPARKMDMEKLKEDVEKDPDAYPYERAEHFGVSQTGICAALKRLGIRREKNVLTSASEPPTAVCLPGPE